jgi:hypothetical protein
VCPATSPPEGWPKPEPKASLVLGKLSDTRKCTLWDHALLAVRVPAVPFAQEGEFRWLKPLDQDDHRIDDATWYCDGSMLNGKWSELRVTGFGIAVVSSEGDLLAHGVGWPPSWCATAAAAEVWAVQVVLAQCPFPPKIRTDCMSILTTAMAGTKAATHHSRPLARVWVRIAQILGVDVVTLVVGGKLVWIPAHKSASAVGESKLSNGDRMSYVDWKANRLVDLLAKAAAEHLSSGRSVLNLLASAEAAAAHAACCLGIVTHAANNHKVDAIGEGGKVITKVVRDSVDEPKLARATSAPPPVAQPIRTRTSDEGNTTALAWVAPTPKVQANRQQRAGSCDALRMRVQDIGGTLATREGKTPASVRLAGLAERVRAKAALGA